MHAEEDKGERSLHLTMDYYLNRRARLRCMVVIRICLWSKNNEWEIGEILRTIIDLYNLSIIDNHDVRLYLEHPDQKIQSIGQ